ncbi:hypothetical protein [Marinibactrum halimedae]|uniref:Uncharacterized protein n=1 Tax=Marinibactrum halimedae TaxID=1444977 RepID=A0AA37WPQ9_9GAMM|nr:hypothetical protein [Marinibactrum halimedae]MCD9459205.1 hypothetical protein [Marinibactrum halimedae]GLS27276.1 hypothetical protein GCM10007877_29950 [Marinibactrum halimedae]
MSSFIALVLFAFIAVSALLVVSWANHRETRRRIIDSKLRQLKRKYEEIQDAITNVDQLIELRAVSVALNEEVISILQSMQQLKPDEGYVVAALNNAEALHEELQKETAHNRVYRIRESDSKILRAQRHLDFAARVLSSQQALGKISQDELNTFREALAWAHLQVGVISVVAQGHQATNRGDILTAAAYYKKAKTLLMQSGHPDPRRLVMIREMSDILHNKRTALSDNLMHEVDYNPDNEVEDPADII